MSEDLYLMEEASSRETSPRPFLEVTDMWLKVHKMTDVFFAREAGRASAKNTLVSILLFSVVSAVLSVAYSAIQASPSWLPAEYIELWTTVMAPGVCSVCTGLLATLGGFYLNSALVYVGARLFGGRGDFTTQTYLQSLYTVPIGVLSGLLALVPLLGCLFPLALALFSAVLAVRAVKAAHDLTTGRAVAAVSTPAAVALLFICIASIALAVVGASLWDVIKDIPIG